MKIVSWNLNGIRAVYKKGLLDWLKSSDIDILCIQEVRASKNQIPTDLLSVNGYEFYNNESSNKGYSGVGIFTKIKPLKIETSIGHKQFDSEGRFIKLTFNNFTLINVYLPHGGRYKERLDYKLSVYSYLINYLQNSNNKDTIIVGDFNIAHTEIDLARPKQNKDNIMFTLGERGQITSLINSGFVDSYRHLYPNGTDYTWYSYGNSAKEKGIGWRIDYAFLNNNLKSKIKNVTVSKDSLGSDHCSLLLEMKDF